MPAIDSDDIGFEIPDYSKLFTIGAFVQSCREGSFNDFLGMGYYATKNRYFPTRRIYCVDAIAGVVDTDYPYVVWMGASID